MGDLQTAGRGKGGWTPERRAAQAARMAANRPVDFRRKSTAELRAEAGMRVYSPVPQEDREHIRALGDIRNDLKSQLAREQAVWEQRRADLLKQIGALSNENLADKFECTVSQVKTALHCAGGR